VQNCEVCGRRFDPLEFQIVVPELSRGFDSIECANRARSQALPGSRIRAMPLVALVEPIAARAPGGGPGLLGRPLATSAATLGLLAAGTAAAALLWLRVVSPDPTGFPLTNSAAPPAVSAETLRADTRPGPEGAGAGTPAFSKKGTASAATVLAAAGRAGEGAAVGAPTDLGTGHGGETTSTTRPLARPAVSSPSTVAARTTDKGLVKHGKGHARPGKGHGKGHAKHGKGHHTHGKGHHTHGKTTETHSTGTGHGRTLSPHAAPSHGHGHGHGKGH
jgi:hypothetical protein